MIQWCVQPQWRCDLDLDWIWNPWRELRGSKLWVCRVQQCFGCWWVWKGKKSKKNAKTILNIKTLSEACVFKCLRKVLHLLGGGTMGPLLSWLSFWLCLSACELSADSRVSMGSPASSGSTLEPLLSACNSKLYRHNAIHKDSTHSPWKTNDCGFCPIVFITMYTVLLPLVVCMVPLSVVGPASCPSVWLAWSALLPAPPFHSGSESALLSLSCLPSSWSRCCPLLGLCRRWAWIEKRKRTQQNI